MPTSSDLKRGDWMQTQSGRRFYPLDPKVDEVDLLDIAHALSMLCRYNGHVDRFYSVAEHSVILADYFADRGEMELALWALIHDAAEAYIGDMIRPLKRSFHMVQFRIIEDRVLSVIAERVGLQFDMANGLPQEVRDADYRILFDEKAQLIRAAREPWHNETELGPLGVTVVGLRPEMARAAWWNKLQYLLPPNISAFNGRADAEEVDAGGAS